MRQEQFVARHQQEWHDLELWLHHRADASRRSRRKAAATDSGDAAFPQRYRRLCQQLALARERGYSPQLVQRLQQLMQQGHSVLYRTPPVRWRRALEFLVADFPMLVRSQARSMWAALAVFALPALGCFAMVQLFPDTVHLLMSSDQIAEMERMYNPAAERLGRDSGTDWMMFGYYIMNNISIALRTFASGLLAGVGTLFVLLFNGITMGAVAGHLQNVGSGDPFWRFVVGHAAFELTAIVIAGGAGLQLGMKLLAPGRRRRLDALVEGGRIGARLCLGVAFMLLVAAFVEAFWSSIAQIPAWGKYSVAGVLWAGVLLWLWRGGRGGSHAD
ncbi:TPA: stage II sporulation protein M [Stenotrophomonas maltophilia]|uniref:stage II sporulation protein M n=1 Tax=Stenotrophomonas TaxID=40323 RepID=UPI0028AEEB8C|nr:stage II sporulation protein M [Stenotrophomonas sp.]HDS0951257.1 stage II sporulation protein M [Stenotrophomonas maltophilia]HDS1027623.1 stage II sporulation protein M [Stenotrophomonas maltophilia]HDS1031797.1 stage II sporulation protein M [Stenotrophomonas maltophilia]HDS1036440.1 stage II sporulation protein M [Stenotrophomonas maltophilia]HDS1037910.1 stage II sporulation protein M [Stenotrophomonas maltophilia]